MNNVKILVAIANYGEKNRQYLDRLLAAYRAMPADIKIVVLSNILKEFVGDVDVRVGMPSDNPWSLPFAHRKLFVENLDKYDFFIYSEDDTLITWETIESFIESDKYLDSNEIAGFLRTEESADGSRYYSTCHSFFRWIPSSVRKRGEHLWARYSNEHSACYMISQDKLRLAIASGGFLMNPHEGRHDMLCAAATDVYTQCGFEKLVCFDNLICYTLPHLPNKYIGKMGLPEAEMEWHKAALRRIFNRELSSYEMLNPETKLPMGIGSKWYREKPDPKICQLLGKDIKNILVWGAGDGVFEADLRERGHQVYVIPLDSIVGECCRKRGLEVLQHDHLEVAFLDKKFDVVVLRDILHLYEKPIDLLKKVFTLLNRNGFFIARIPNFHQIGLLKRRLTDPRFKMLWSKDNLHATPFTLRGLKQLAREAGFRQVNVQVDVPKKRTMINLLTFFVLSKVLSPYFYLSGK